MNDIISRLTEFLGPAGSSALGHALIGLDDNILTMAFGFTIGSVAVAAAIAFGLGGRDAAKTVADGWAARISGK